MTELLIEPFTLPYIQRATLEILLLSVVAGFIGPWIVLRSLAFHSHAVGVSTFPGLVLADGIGASAQLLALGTAGLFTASSSVLGRVRNATSDAVTALILVGCLAIGVILASDVFSSGANVDSLLFGSLLSVGSADLYFAAGTAVLAVGSSALLSRHWLARGFDEGFAGETGSGSRWFDLALLLIVAVAVIATLNAIGALLVIALMVVPAATVRLVTRRIRTLQAGTLGLVLAEGIVGIWLSVQTDAPPGATIAVLSGVVFGLVAGWRSLRSSRGSRKALGVAGALAVTASLLLGCSSGSGESEAGGVSAVATTTQIADIVGEVGGDRVEVTQLLRPNTDPHQYEPRPSDVAALSEAEVVFRNGGHLDEWVGKLIEDSGSDARIIDLGETIPVRLAESGRPDYHDHGGGDFDAHWWHDPTNVQAAAAKVATVLGSLDPRAKGLFRRNANRYEAELAALDESIRTCIERIPREDRKLVTDHESFGYFANRYGITVVGAVIPALTTQAEASAGDLARLEETIRSEGVNAVFPESSLPSETAEAIARDSGASAEYSLFGDSLGPDDSGAGTYIGMMRTNADRIARGLSDGTVGCGFP
ncbi:MAG: metal ABC transporter solute-binding protein, Zn/Mn family [Solirubrobacterales bacterium]